MQPNINNMKTYYNNTAAPASANFSGPVSNGAVLDNNPLVKQAEKVDEGNNAILAGGVIGGTAALLGASEFVNRALRKDYSGTFFNKIEKWGDKIGAKPFISRISSAISGGFDRAKNSTFVKNSEIINTMMNKPGMAGPMGQPQAYSVRGFLVGNALDALKSYSSMEATDLLKNYAKNPSGYSSALNAVRDRLINSSSQMQLLDRFIANPSQNLSAVLNEFKLPQNQQILRNYAANPTAFKDIIQNFKYAQSKNPVVLRALDDFIANPADPDKLNKILRSAEKLSVDADLTKIIKLGEKDSYKYRKEIIQKIEELVSKNPALKDKLLRSNGASMFMPKWLVPKFLREKVTFNEILNKAKLIENYKNYKSPLGAKLSGGLFRSLEAATNGMVGGKLGVLMQALFIGQSLKSAVDAPKGEKVATFMEELVSMMAYTLTMGLQMRALNSVAGLKFLGMSEADYKNYHRAVALAKQAAKSGDARNYYRFKNAIKTYEARANANLKPWQKPVKWFGKLLSIGRVKETVRPLKSKPKNAAQIPFTGLKNTFKAIPYKLKTVGGFVGRAALIMAVISPVFSNWAVKISHKIFGKPTNSILDGMKSDEQANIPPETSSLPGQAPVVPQQASAQVKPGNLVDIMNNRYRNPALQTAANPQAVPPTGTSQQVPAGNLVSQVPIASQSMTPQASAPVRTYMPNPVLGDETFADPGLQQKYSVINAAILQAEQAEREAQKFLTGY